MDPATVFQIACGAFQLVDICYKGAKTIRELHQSRSGLTRENERIKRATQDLDQASSSVKNGILSLRSLDTNSLTRDERRLQNVCEDCIRISGEIYRQLNPLQHEKNSKLKLMGQVRSTFTRKSKIEDLHRELDERRKQLDTDLLITLRRIDTTNAAQVQTLLEIDIGGLKDKIAFQELSQSLQDILSSLPHSMHTVVNQHTSKELENSQLARSDLEARQSLIDQLSFSEMYLRESNLNATEGTFNWVFDKSMGSRPFDDFIDWLQHGNSIYWINGKVGSGKSTLMKFIAEKEDTREHLAKWLPGHDLMLLTFFFWRTGSTEQRSITGLLRAVLVQIIEQKPDLCDMIFEDLGFAPAAASPMEKLKFPQRWNFRKLSQALRTLLGLISSKYKICMVIDGLDEYEGDTHDHEVLFETLRLFTSYQHVKVLVSSRPEPYLQSAFNVYPRLKLQDLTARDMEVYVRVKFFDNPLIRASIAPQDIPALRTVAKDLHNKADGVFLWLRLAIAELIDGLNTHDTLHQLQDRLRGLDEKLSSLYLKMLRRISPVHRQEVILVLKILLDHIRNMRDRGMSESLGVLNIGLAIEQYSRPISADLWDEHFDYASFAQNMAKHLEKISHKCLTQFAGLIDLTGDSHDVQNAVDPCAGSRHGIRIFPVTCHCENIKVQFVHRSVFDFLQQDEFAIQFLADDRVSFDDVARYVFQMSLNYAAIWIGCALELTRSTANSASEAGDHTANETHNLPLAFYSDNMSKSSFEPRLTSFLKGSQAFLFYVMSENGTLERCSPADTSIMEILSHSSKWFSNVAGKMIKILGTGRNTKEDVLVELTSFSNSALIGAQVYMPRLAALYNLRYRYFELLLPYGPFERQHVIGCCITAKFFRLMPCRSSSLSITHMVSDLKTIDYLLLLGADPNWIVPAELHVLPTSRGREWHFQYDGFSLADFTYNQTLWHLFLVCLVQILGYYATVALTDFNLGIAAQLGSEEKEAMVALIQRFTERDADMRSLLRFSNLHKDNSGDFIWILSVSATPGSMIDLIMDAIALPQLKSLSGALRILGTASDCQIYNITPMRHQEWSRKNRRQTWGRYAQIYPTHIFSTPELSRYIADEWLTNYRIYIANSDLGSSIWDNFNRLLHKMYLSDTGGIESVGKILEWTTNEGNSLTDIIEGQPFVLVLKPAKLPSDFQRRHPHVVPNLTLRSTGSFGVLEICSFMWYY